MTKIVPLSHRSQPPAQPDRMVEKNKIHPIVPGHCSQPPKSRSADTLPPLTFPTPLLNGFLPRRICSSIRPTFRLISFIKRMFGHHLFDRFWNHHLCLSGHPRCLHIPLKIRIQSSPPSPGCSGINLCTNTHRGNEHPVKKQQKPFPIGKGIPTGHLPKGPRLFPERRNRGPSRISLTE